MTLETRSQIIYPESDGKPMADNTRQFQWIARIKGGLDALFRDDPSVFVAGDLLWYPVEGRPDIRVAPDVLTAFGRPKSHRGSYKQWEEGGIAPQVVFEILSPANTVMEMSRKQQFYERHGVEEYYLIDPERGEATGWVRFQNFLRQIDDLHGWLSPRLQIRFENADGDWQIFGPDGRPFTDYAQLAAERDVLSAERGAAETRAQRLAERLRALGIDPEETS